MKFYSPKEDTFFSREIHDTMPGDAVEITDAQWVEFVELRSKGHKICFDDKGVSVGDRTLATVLPVDSGRMREHLIDATDPLAIRHMRQELRFTAPEMESLAKKGKALTLSQFKELEAYTQALRDLPTALKTWPVVAEGDWPKKPAFL